ncbi:MAG: DUF952 domain-containing protein [Nostocaceae cyanobacterium]|nr:DUF952 domain-containing protein [Nostocaceae cyanobacterium]
MTTILHITQQQQWQQAQFLGTYSGDTLQSEGFIHCCTPQQVIKVANRFFPHQQGLVLLVIDADRVHADIRYETAEENESFPHIYGALNLDAVSKVIGFEAGEDGLFHVLPDI